MEIEFDTGLTVEEEVLLDELDCLYKEIARLRYDKKFNEADKVAAIVTKCEKDLKAKGLI